MTSKRLRSRISCGAKKLLRAALIAIGSWSADAPSIASPISPFSVSLQRSLAATHAGELLIIMQVQLDKPATGAWSGMINDPDLDGSFQINKGFRQARQLLLDINRLGLAAATKYLDTISPQFVADLISLNTTDSRTSESRLHRELASGLSVLCGGSRDAKAEAGGMDGT